MGIAKSTVDKYITEAMQLLGVNERRDAALIAFGAFPPAGIGAVPAGVPDATATGAEEPASTGEPAAPRAWRTRRRPRNTLTFVQTIGWMAVIAIGSLFALTLATVFANGVAPVARAVLGSLARHSH